MESEYCRILLMAVILRQYLGKQAKMASAFGGIIQVALRATFQVKSEHSEGAIQKCVKMNLTLCITI